ncbi:MAG: hypothetical protein E7430_09175 [Ruminococcaceae bacterium]|nr:hypothetical protein [Oscillospiraceae bacterium]
MQRILDRTKAVVDITITGAYPEEFINRLAADSIPFWGLRKKDPLNWDITMFALDYRTIRKIAKRSMCRTHIRRKRGLPFRINRFVKRRILILGIASAILAALTLPLFIWTFEVEGNATVSDREIIRALDEIGVDVGTFGYSVNPVLTETKMLLKIPELSYLTINVKGGKATVVVREDVPAPEVLDETVVTDLVATETGVITKMEILRGKSLVENGQTVLKGEKLVSGIIEHYANDNLLTVQTVRSMGEVYARTWKKLTATMPLEYTQKEPTGEEKTKYSLIIGSKRINFYFNSGNSYDKCDKIIDTDYLTLPGGVRFPLALEKTTEKACKTTVASMDDQTAEKLLQDYLARSIQLQLLGGRIIRTDFETDFGDGLITVSAVAECEQQIATEVMTQIPVETDNAPQ